MIRTLLATTALATLLASGAYAQTTAPATTTTDPAAATAPAEAPVERADGHLASNIIGENVYNGVADDAENIGTVNDIVVGLDGTAEMVVIGVGGFLGLGEKDISVAYDEVEWAQREDGTTWLVINATREQLEQQAEFERDAYDPEVAVAAAPADDAAEDTAAAPAADDADDTAMAPADDFAMEGDTAEAPADDAAMESDTAEAPADGDAAMESDTAEAPADGEAAMESDSAEAPAEDDAATDGMAAAPAADDAADDTAAATDDAAATDGTETAAIDRSTLTEVPMEEISADNLIGTTVYGADEENVGSIEDVILGDDGQVDVVTVDVGGFLGIGAKQVAVDLENLAFMSDEDGEMYLYTSFTEEQLEAQPEYDEATFADQRDDQLLVNPAE